MSFASLVTDAISSALATVGCFERATFYGIAELATKDEKTFPVCVTGNGAGKQIIPDQTKAIQIYYRVRSMDNTPDEDGFGVGERAVELGLSVFLLSNLKAFPAACGSSQEEIQALLADSIPDTLTISGFYQVQTDEISRAGTKAQIIQSEFPGWDIQNHILDLVIAGAEVTITAKTCESTC